MCRVIVGSVDEAKASSHPLIFVMLLGGLTLLPEPARPMTDVTVLSPQNQTSNNMVAMTVTCCMTFSGSTRAICLAAEISS
jgi:hypothetical protein